MKKILYTFLFCLSSSTVLSQSNQVCNGIKYDTLAINIVVEINSDSWYYSENDAIIQANEMYADNDFKKNTVQRMYNSDTIIAGPWSSKNNYSYLSNCLKISSINSFFSTIDLSILTNREYRKIKKFIFKDSRGNRYLRVFARLVVIDMGKTEWLIPKIFSSAKENNCSNHFNYCERTFNHALIIADVISFHLRKR